MVNKMSLIVYNKKKNARPIIFFELVDHVINLWLESVKNK
jgi:hypothetical protein